jgi:hypothetical protein
MERLAYSLWNYTSMTSLLLDNNKIGDSGAKILASCVASMNLSHLNVGFNDIGAEGVIALLQASLMPIESSSMSVLNLSGSVFNTDVARLLADLLVRNKTLTELYLDRTNIGSAGERHIAAGIASNRLCGLVSFTGFDLGEVLITLGSPAELAIMPNKKALRYLAEMWRAHEAKEISGNSSHCSTSAEDDDQITRNLPAISKGRSSLQIAAEQLQMSSFSSVSLLSIGNELFSIDESNISRTVCPHTIENAIPAEISTIRSLLKKYGPALREISLLPFLPADMWLLHQYYFSPTPSVDQARKSLDGSTSDSDEESPAIVRKSRSTWVEQPKKRHGNKRNMARIAGYPRLKV